MVLKTTYNPAGCGTCPKKKKKQKRSALIADSAVYVYHICMYLPQALRQTVDEATYLNPLVVVGGRTLPSVLRQRRGAGKCVKESVLMLCVRNDIATYFGVQDLQALLYAGRPHCSGQEACNCQELMQSPGDLMSSAMLPCKAYTTVSGKALTDRPVPPFVVSIASSHRGLVFRPLQVGIPVHTIWK